MITRSRSYLLILLSIICFFSCKEEEVIAPLELIDLDPLPEGSVAFLNLDINEDSYRLVNDGSGSVFSTSLATSVDPDANRSDQYGASISSDTSLLIFTLAYTRSSNSRNELLHELTSENDRIAYRTLVNGELSDVNTGFLFEITELEAPLGAGVSFSSMRTMQTEDSFFTVEGYYAGETEDTIWVKGSFQLLVLNQVTTVVAGDFLLELTLCCFD